MNPRSLLEAFLTPPRTRELSREQELTAQADTFHLALPEAGLARGGGDEIKVYRWGQGLPALIVHGWGSRATHFEALIVALQDAGFSVTGFDAPGHGRSTGTISGAPAIAAAIRAVVAAHGPFRVVVAHSLGAVAVALVLGRELHVDRAVLLGACCWVEPLAVAFGREKGASDADIQTMLDIARREFRPDEISAELSAPAFGHVPVLMMHDPADAEMPHAHSAALAKAWPGTILIDTPGVGHRRILRAREIVNRTVQFLQKQTVVP